MFPRELISTPNVPEVRNAWDVARPASAKAGALKRVKTALGDLLTITGKGSRAESRRSAAPSGSAPSLALTTAPPLTAQPSSALSRELPRETLGSLLTMQGKGMCQESRINEAQGVLNPLKIAGSDWEQPDTSAHFVLAPPVITPPGGASSDTQVIITMEAEEGCWIEYRTDGVLPPTAKGVQGRYDEGSKWPGCCVYRRPIIFDEAGDLRVVARARKGSYVSEPVEAHFSQQRVLRVLPTAVVSGVLRVLNGAAAAAAEKARQAYERALSHTLQTQVAVRVDHSKREGTRIRFSADASDDEQAAALVAEVKSLSFLTRLSLWLRGEGMKVKAEDLEVTSVASHPLEVVKLHLDWRFPPRNSGQTLDYDGVGKVDYLDGSCLLFEEGECKGIVDYRGGEKKKKEEGSVPVADAAVHHSGDVMRRDGGRHEITVRLPELPEPTTDVFFALSAYNCGDLSLFRAPSIRFFDAFDDSPLAEYTVSAFGNAQAVVMAKLQRHHKTWRVVAHGVTSSGTVRDYAPILKDIAPLQAAYDRRRRRFWLIRLGALLASGRMLVRASVSQEAQLLERIFDDVPEAVFRQIVQCL